MSDGSQIKVLMERLVAVMREKGMRAPEHFNPGLSRQEILDLTAGVLELPEDVIEFYEFMNGTTLPDDMDQPWVFETYPSYIVLPLQKALAERESIIKRLIEVVPEWVDEDGEEPSGWIPIFADGIYCFLVDTERASKKRHCIFHIIKAYVPYIRYANLESMLRTMVVCYEQDAYIVVDGTIVDINDSKEQIIERAYNPGVR